MAISEVNADLFMDPTLPSDGTPESEYLHSQLGQQDQESGQTSHISSNKSRSMLLNVGNLGIVPVKRETFSTFEDKQRVSASIGKVLQFTNRIFKDAYCLNTNLEIFDGFMENGKIRIGDDDILNNQSKDVSDKDSPCFSQKKDYNQHSPKNQKNTKNGEVPGNKRNIDFVSSFSENKSSPFREEASFDDFEPEKSYQKKLKEKPQNLRNGNQKISNSLFQEGAYLQDQQSHLPSKLNQSGRRSNSDFNQRSNSNKPYFGRTHTNHRLQNNLMEEDLEGATGPYFHTQDVSDRKLHYGRMFDGLECTNSKRRFPLNKYHVQEGEGNKIYRPVNDIYPDKFTPYHTMGDSSSMIYPASINRIYTETTSNIQDGNHSQRNYYSQRNLSSSSSNIYNNQGSNVMNIPSTQTKTHTTTSIRAGIIQPPYKIQNSSPRHKQVKSRVFELSKITDVSHHPRLKPFPNNSSKKKLFKNSSKIQRDKIISDRFNLKNPNQHIKKTNPSKSGNISNLHKFSRTSFQKNDLKSRRNHLKNYRHQSKKQSQYKYQDNKRIYPPQVMRVNIDSLSEAYPKRILKSSNKEQQIYHTNHSQISSSRREPIKLRPYQLPGGDSHPSEIHRLRNTPQSLNKSQCESSLEKLPKKRLSSRTKAHKITVDVDLLSARALAQFGGRLN